MPDPGWGLLNPLGQRVDYGLGQPTLLKDAAASTLLLAPSNLIAGTTSFVGPPPYYSSSQRAFLCSSDAGPARLLYMASAIQIGQPPFYEVRAGTVKDGAFETLLRFSSSGGDSLPDLGQTSATVWSICPIPPCRALKRGGYLVGATLYFAPWAEDEWEQEPGARDATFRDSGQGWVPAVPGAIGPYPYSHAPVYLTVLDEWTAHRSLYGPDALIVLDEEGAFVECLNSEQFYPPDGRAVLVTTESVPRVIFRIYKEGTYSDFAEAWGQYQALPDDEEIQAPLFACYELMDGKGRIVPGAGRFCGFLDMYAVGRQNSTWRWDTVAPTLYDWEYPKTQWSPPGGCYLRAGKGGLQVSPLFPASQMTRNGVRGVGQRA
jgi:hypothetical protein